MRKLLMIMVLALAALPAVALAQETPSPEDQQNAAKRCSALRTQLGATTFNATYGTNASKSNAYGKCVSKLAREEQQTAQSASKQCRAEQADANFASTHGGKSFVQFYGGTAKNASKVAFGKCVSSKKQAESTDDQATTMNAAQKCKAQRTAMGERDFASLYGTNDNDRNAFGKCVSKLSSSHEQSESKALAACKAQLADSNFAASHGGKSFAEFYGGATEAEQLANCVKAQTKKADDAQQTKTLSAAKQCKAERAADAAAFKQKYGTNASKSNAFGKCVSAKAKAQQ
jgi:hypothetical protein